MTAIAPTRKDVVLQQLLDRAVGGEAAAGERGFLVADAVGELDERLGVDAELLRERAHDALGLGAVARLAAQAVLACAAPVATTGPSEAQDHPVADRHVAVGAGAELLDDADALVAEGHVGRHTVPITACDVEVGVADAGRSHPDQRLLVPRCGRGQVLDPDLSLNESCCLHAMSPVCSVPSRPHNHMPPTSPSIGRLGSTLLIDRGLTATSSPLTRASRRPARRGAVRART